jgi:hypothetical protein
MCHYFWRFIHNAIIHPLIGVFGERKWIQFLHDSTGERWNKYGAKRDTL